MSTQRDAGLEALQKGDFIGAVTLLEEACQLAPEDYDAHLYLGAAYGGSGKQMEAINALTKSVVIQPSNGQARYNLGVAMERAGYLDQAKQAFEQAILLQPEYPQAQQALAKMQGASRPVQKPASHPDFAVENAGEKEQAASFTPQVDSYTPPTMQPIYKPELTQSIADNGTPSSEQPAPLNGAPQPAPLYGAPQQTEAMPAQPAPLYGAPLQAPPQTQAPGGYAPTGSPLPQGGSLNQYAPPITPYGAPRGGGEAFYQQPMANYREDTFDLKQAWSDMWLIIRNPNRFFDEQVGLTGMKSSMAMLFIMTLMISIPLCLFNPLIILGLVVILPIYYVCFILGNLILGGYYHLAGKIFGNQSNYEASFRASVASSVPLILISMISTTIIAVCTWTGIIHAFTSPNFLKSMSTPGATMPTEFVGGIILMYVVSFCGWGISSIWGTVLLVIGLSKLQNTSTGSAVGTVIVSYIINIVLFVAFYFLFIVAIFAALAAATAGGRH